MGSVDDAVAAEGNGADLIVCQGEEAGGHVVGDTPLQALIPAVCDAVRVPVLAAGGIGSGRALAMVLAAGADGARIGTRFAAAAESLAHPLWKSRLVEASAAGTSLTTAFRVGWDLQQRVLTSAIDAVHRFEGTEVGAEQFGPVTVPIPRFSMIPPSANATGHIDAMALYGSSAVGGIHDIKPAADIIAELMKEATDALRHTTSYFVDGSG